MVSQARWQPHVCLKSVGGQTEVKEQICPPPCAASCFSLLFFALYIISILFICPSLLKIQRKNHRGQIAGDGSSSGISRRPYTVVMHFLLFWGHVWSRIGDDMFCRCFQTPFVCNANGCDSPGKEWIALETLAAQSSAMTDPNVNCVWRGWF